MWLLHSGTRSILFINAKSPYLVFLRKVLNFKYSWKGIQFELENTLIKIAILKNIMGARTPHNSFEGSGTDVVPRKLRASKIIEVLRAPPQKGYSLFMMGPSLVISVSLFFFFKKGIKTNNTKEKVYAFDPPCQPSQPRKIAYYIKN